MKTIGTEPDAIAWQHDWAAQQLGITANASPAEVRAAFLRRLPQVGFTPPRSWRLALQILTGQSTGEMGIYAEDARNWEDQLRTEIDAFTHEFWQLSVEERQEKWNDLFHRSTPWPRLRHWLSTLQPGLSVGPMPRNIKMSDREMKEVLERLRSREISVEEFYELINKQRSKYYPLHKNAPQSIQRVPPAPVTQAVSPINPPRGTQRNGFADLVGPPYSAPRKENEP